jgi:hypothetical protein
VRRSPIRRSTASFSSGEYSIQCEISSIVRQQPWHQPVPGSSTQIALHGEGG